MLHSTSPTAPPQLSLPHNTLSSCIAGSEQRQSFDKGESPSQPLQRGAATEILVPPSGLPIELVDRVLDFCDYPTFLCLAQVNRFFNFYATEVLLSREVISWRFKRMRVPYCSPYKTEILAALNIRQFDIHTLSRLDYRFDDRERLCRHIAAMMRFIRNRIMSIESLILRFELSMSMYWSVTEALACTSKLVLLLEAALVKGCQRFHLSGKLPSFAYYPRTQIVIPCTPHSTREQYCVRRARWFQSHPSQPTPPPPLGPPFIRFPKPRIPAPSLAWESRLSFVTDAPSLTELEMESSLMLAPSLLSHTFNLLRNQSPVLRKLKIHHRGPVCEEFFSAITLPVLDSFAYLADYIPPGLFDLLFLFLIRHPALRTVRFPPVGTHSTIEYPTFDVNMFLPNLKALYAHGKTMSFLLRDPKAFLSLERISIEAKNRHIFKQYGDVDAALVVLGSRMNTSPSSCKSPIHLKLNFSADDDFCLWLSSHITKSCDSPIQRLKRVETLTISLKDVYAKLEARHLDTLITWVGLFPDLRWLRLDGYFRNKLYEATVRTEGFITVLKDVCPRLERCTVNYWDWDRDVQAWT